MRTFRGCVKLQRVNLHSLLEWHKYEQLLVAIALKVVPGLEEILNAVLLVLVQAGTLRHRDLRGNVRLKCVRIMTTE